MLAASVILARFASAFAAPSSKVGVGAAETKEVASINRVMESFMAGESQLQSVEWCCCGTRQYQRDLKLNLYALSAFESLGSQSDGLARFQGQASPTSVIHYHRALLGGSEALIAVRGTRYLIEISCQYIL